LKKELEEEYAEALEENKRKMAEMQKNYDEMLKEAEESDAVSNFLFSKLKSNFIICFLNQKYPIHYTVINEKQNLPALY